MLAFIISSCAGGNYPSSFNKSNRKYYKWRYASTIKKPTKVCREVRRNKKQKKNRKVRTKGDNSWRTSSDVYAMAEVDNPSEMNRQPKPVAQKPAPKPEPKQEEDFHNKSFDEQTLEERHKIEDEVLERNNLPKPTSKKHEEIRKLVADKLKDHKDGDPIKLEPLYFIFDDAEFAVVDMDPFLIAVEYALQGRMILIEGHTDNQGKDNYNVDLSMQRVDKIRQLMHDMGVPDDRISVIGYGEEISKHENSTEEGRQLNRRVDFTVF
ncbi:MAG: OmpA family protein [Candidatus Cyclobacteriaceae bacterium M2_1C_046]